MQVRTLSHAILTNPSVLVINRDSASPAARTGARHDRHHHRTRLEITPLSGTIGAELRGVDLKRPLDADTVRDIRQALVAFKVIFFPGQHLSAEEHKEFALQFGQITNAHPVVPGVGEHKEVFEIDYTKARQLFDAQTTEKYGRTRNPWHTDVTFMDHPPLGSVLNAIVIPEAGGDTVFADTQAAYDACRALPCLPRRPSHGARRAAVVPAPSQPPR